MALNSQNKIFADDFINIKARVKAEMNRRKYNGSLVSYAGTDYDYTITPAPGVLIKPEHVNKLFVPVNAITPSGYTEKVKGDAVPELDTFDIKLRAHEAYPLRGSGTDCASSCSGLCSSGCYNTCSGCGGVCSYGCGSGCEGDCYGNCKGDCGDGCTATCGTCNGCSTNCWGGCDANCWGVNTTGTGNGSNVK